MPFSGPRECRGGVAEGVVRVRARGREREGPRGGTIVARVGEGWRTGAFLGQAEDLLQIPLRALLCFLNEAEVLVRAETCRDARSQNSGEVGVPSQEEDLVQKVHCLREGTSFLKNEGGGGHDQKVLRTLARGRFA